MLHVLIVDDEAPARQRLRKLIAPYVAAKRLIIIGEAADGPEALRMLASEKVDLLFLDIRMPGMDGLSVVERIAPERLPVVVFTTAHDEHAMSAFEANAVAYLLKPIERERLDDAIFRAERLQETSDQWRENKSQLEQLLDWVENQTTADSPSPDKPVQRYMGRISIPYRDRVLIMDIDRLVSAEIVDGITRLFMMTDDDIDKGARSRLRQYIVSYTLDHLVTNLDPASFMRVHRSAIVQLASIREMIPWFSGRYKLVLEGKHEVIASRERSRTLKERLMI